MPTGIGIDPATVTGWCTVHENGTWKLKHGDEGNGVMLNRFEEQLSLMNQDDELEWIAYEEAGHGGGRPSDVMFQGQMRGILLSVAAKLGIESYGFVPSTIKKFATGHGFAKKDQMVAAAARVLKRRVIDHNDADACFIYEMGKQGIEPTYLDGRSVKQMKKRASRRAKRAEPKLF